MLTDTYRLIYLITNLFNVVIISKFMNAFYQKRTTSKIICLLSCLSYFVITSVVYLNLDIPMLTLIVNYVIIFGISFNYESHLKRKFLISLYILLFMVIPEFLIAALTGFIHFSFFSEGGYSNSIGAVAVRLVTYMEALLIKNYKTVKNNQKVSNSEWAASIFVPVTTLILEIMIIQSHQLSKAVVITSLCLVFTLNFIAFYLYDSLADSYMKIASFAVIEKENELYSKQCEMMQTSTESLQAFRHDLCNQFAVVSELMEKEKYDLARKQISSLFQQTMNNAIYSTTGNMVIDSLINYKLQSAFNKKIKIDSDIAVPENLDMDVTDIITIIGNLLDNAIRAVTELPEDKRNLFMKIVYSQDRLIIQSINPYCSEVKYSNGEIISSKEDADNHGYGIKNIEHIVNKYDGYMEINHEHSLFKVDILLYLVRS
ncbi:MAG: GHKL domain-containing protein [Ruminococcus sp.]|nr:GHKL domain-containing protein [Ruminococcus sp.]